MTTAARAHGPRRASAVAAGFDPDVKLIACRGGSDPGAEQAWKAAGFHPVVLSSTDLLPSLSSRMVNVIRG